MSWNPGFRSQYGIRNICRQRILDEVLLANKVPNEWKLLIVDEFAMKVIDGCFKTEEVMACNVALIERLEEVREPVGYLEAMYMLQPTMESTKHLSVDLKPAFRMYKSAHIFFLSNVPDDIFDELAKNLWPDFVQSFVEIDILFLPKEAQVYSLNVPNFFSEYFDVYKEVDMLNYEMTAKRLVTLLSTLQEIPFIRYRRDFVKNLILAEAIEQEIENHQYLFKQQSSRNTSILLILDRGFDCISPVVHEFTFQAMAYDLLDIKDDVYEFITGHAEDKTIESISLSDECSLWRQLRHEHIANVTRIIQNMFEADDLMKVTKSVGSNVMNLPALNEAIKKHLQLKSHERFYAYRYMANEIMKLYCDGINVIYQLEQSLSTKTDSQERPVKNMHQSVTGALTKGNVDLPEKLRLLLLYIFYTKGITRAKFDEICNKTQIPTSQAYTIANILHLDIDLFKPGYCEPVDTSVPKKDIESATKFKQSRWTPVLNSILLSCVDGSLSEVGFPYLNGKPQVSFERTGYWCTDKKSDKVSHLIVFIAGGVTYSEMRCAYEVMSEHTGWEIFVGGDDILTPNVFIEKLQALPNFIT